MFKLFQNKNGELQDITELLTINVAKALISDMAIEKAVNMIAKAIAKSEFIVNRNNRRVKDGIYWMLNIQPNPNETATEFWMKAVQKLLLQQECAIVQFQDSIYRAYSFQADKAVAKSKRYNNVVIEAKDDTYQLYRVFKAEDVMHLVNPNRKIMEYLKKNIGYYNTIASGLLASKKISSIPKFALDIEGATPIIRRKKEDGTEQILTIDKYKEEIKGLLESENIEIITNQTGLKVSHMAISTGITSEDITKITKEIYTECAYAFDIPRAVFLGEITEKADSTNEFITYAVNWLVELLNDAMNATFVGKEGFLNGEKIWIDLSKYKHVDVIESAPNLDKLRAIGFTLDEIFELINWMPLNNEFSKQRALTKNYANEEGGANGEKNNS